VLWLTELFYESLQHYLREFFVNFSKLKSFCNSTPSVTPCPAVNTSVPVRFRRYTRYYNIFKLAKLHVAQSLPG